MAFWAVEEIESVESFVIEEFIERVENFRECSFGIHVLRCAEMNCRADRTRLTRIKELFDASKVDFGCAEHN